jgi:hypothetical protein
MQKNLGDVVVAFGIAQKNAQHAKCRAVFGALLPTRLQHLENDLGALGRAAQAATAEHKGPHVSIAHRLAVRHLRWAEELHNLN